MHANALKPFKKELAWLSRMPSLKEGVVLPGSLKGGGKALSHHSKALRASVQGWPHLKPTLTYGL